MLLHLALMLGLSTAALAAALLFTGEEINKDTIVKCIGINVAVVLLSLVPFVGMLSGFIWIAAVMSVFEKTFMEAILVSVVCTVITVFGSFMIGGTLIGSQTERQQSTLVIHCYEGNFNLLDHSGQIVKTTETVAETIAAIRGPDIAPLIRNGQVKIRHDRTENGFPKGEVGELAGSLHPPLVKSVEFIN